MSEKKCPLCKAGEKYQIKRGDRYYCNMCSSYYDLPEDCSEATDTSVSLVDKYLKGGNVVKKNELPVDLMPMEILMKKAYAYENGEECNLMKAFKFFNVAAERGNSEAMYKVGYAYENGLGTVADKKLAVFWYKEGARCGNERCARVLAERFGISVYGGKSVGVEPPINLDDVTSVSHAENQSSIPALCEKLLPSVVRIHNESGHSEGTGFIVAGGYIVTNAHVITYINVNKETGIADNLWISFHPGVSKQKYAAKVIAYDINQDVAIVKCLNDSKFSAYSVRLADSDRVRIGEDVFTMGNGEGLGIAFTKLYIAQKAGASDIRTKHREVLQLSGGTNHGNSGGPVFDMNGDVVGVITFGYREYTGKKINIDSTGGTVRLTEADEYKEANNMSFAITSNTVRSLAAKIDLVL